MLQRRKNSLASAGNRSPGHPARNLHINIAPYFFQTRYESCIIAKSNILELDDGTYSSVSSVAQSVYRLAMDWTVRGSNPGGGEIFRTCPDCSWGPPNLLYYGYQIFPGGKERPRCDADTSPHLVPWSRKSRTIPLLHLWAVRPAQSLGACTRVHFSFTFIYSWSDYIIEALS